MVLALTLTLVLVLTLALAPSGMISKKGVPAFLSSTVALCSSFKGLNLDFLGLHRAVWSIGGLNLDENHTANPFLTLPGPENSLPEPVMKHF